MKTCTKRKIVIIWWKRVNYRQLNYHCREAKLPNNQQSIVPKRINNTLFPIIFMRTQSQLATYPLFYLQEKVLVTETNPIKVRNILNFIKINPVIRNLCVPTNCLMFQRMFSWRLIRIKMITKILFFFIKSLPMNRLLKSFPKRPLMAGLKVPFLEKSWVQVPVF